MTKRKPLSEFLSRALGRTTQSDLARALGVSPSTVSLWARGKREVPETYRAALRSASRGHRITAPPPPTTATGAPRRTRGSATRVQMPNGRTHVRTKALKPFARELGAALAAGKSPSSITVTVSGFTGIGSKPDPARTRRIELSGLSSDQLTTLAGGSRADMEDALTQAIHATNFSGGFTYHRITSTEFNA
jgi:hypothetical protein